MPNNSNPTTKVPDYTVESINSILASDFPTPAYLNTFLDYKYSQSHTPTERAQARANMGLNPVSKTDKMIEPVYIDSNGHLRTYKYSSNLHDLTIDEFRSFIRKGLAPTMFRVGDQIGIHFGSVEHRFRIIDFDYDTPADVTIPHTVTLQDINLYYGSNFGETASWKDSDARRFLNSMAPDGYLAQIEPEVANAFIAVQKITRANESTESYYITEDKVFLPSAFELNDDVSSEVFTGYESSYGAGAKKASNPINIPYKYYYGKPQYLRNMPAYVSGEIYFPSYWLRSPYLTTDNLHEKAVDGGGGTPGLIWGRGVDDSPTYIAPMVVIG